MALSIRFGRAAATSYLTRTASLPPITAFTFMAWFRLQVDTGNETCIFCYGSEPYAYYEAYVDASHPFYLWNGTTNSAAGTSPDVGRWYHLAVTVAGASGSNYLSYINGVLDITHTAASNTGTTLRLGETLDVVGYFNGDLAAVKIWNRVLTRAEIVAEMPFALPVNRAGLNSCYPVPNGWDVLAWGRGSPVVACGRWSDWSGNGLQWTETGTIDLEPGPPIG